MELQALMSVIVRLLLPDSQDLALETVQIDEKTKRLIVAVRSRQVAPQCPLCQRPTTRMHSTYTRTVADLPWADVSVQLHMTVRKCFCLTDTCPRSIFTERLSKVVAPWARRTLRLAQQQWAIGLALGGAAGQRLERHLNRTTSHATLIRFVRQMPLDTPPQPRVLGVDEWAQRKGQRYGSILVDLERQTVIDVLPERSVETFAQGLCEHPGVEILSRDRAGTYAEGARQGAPDAQQVADRWHFLKNLSEALVRMLEPHQEALAGRMPARASL